MLGRDSFLWVWVVLKANGLDLSLVAGGKGPGKAPGYSLPLEQTRGKGINCQTLSAWF